MIKQKQIQTCHDCGAEEGQLHLGGCDMDHCSKCGEQTLLHRRCKGSKPEPYFRPCLSCARCGIVFPEFKMVGDEEWKYICGVTYQESDILCEECMNFIFKARNKLNKFKGKRTSWRCGGL
jgi:hypothetical protein